MKNLFLLLILLSLFGCSKDDTTSQDDPKISDPIVGAWIPQKRVKVYNDSIIESLVTHCENREQNTVAFIDNERQGFFLFYSEINENPTEAENFCLEKSGKGSWTKTGDQKYSVEISYYEVNTNNSNAIGEETKIYRAAFPSNDTLHLHDLKKLEELKTEDEIIKDYFVVLAKNNYDTPIHTQE